MACTNIEQLPEEIMVYVFHFLRYDWLQCVARLVNRRWKELTRDSKLLRHFCPEQYWSAARTTREIARVSQSLHSLQFASDEVMEALLSRMSAQREQSRMLQRENLQDAVGKEAEHGSKADAIQDRAEILAEDTEHGSKADAIQDRAEILAEDTGHAANVNKSASCVPQRGDGLLFASASTVSGTCPEFVSLRRLQLSYVHEGLILSQLPLYAPALTHLTMHSSDSAMLPHLLAMMRLLPKLHVRALLKLHQAELLFSGSLLLELMNYKIDITMQFLSIDVFHESVCSILDKLCFQLSLKQQFDAKSLLDSTVMQSIGSKVTELRVRLFSFSSLREISQLFSSLTTLDCKLPPFDTDQDIAALTSALFPRLTDLTLRSDTYKLVRRAPSRGLEVTKLLKCCPALRRLSVMHMVITPEAIDVLPVHLQAVRFQDVFYKDSPGPSTATSLSLSSISLEYKQLADACNLLYVLGNYMTQLSSLSLRLEKHEQSALERLAESLSLCTSLEDCALTFATKVTSADAAQQTLSRLYNCRAVTLHGLSRFVPQFLREQVRGSSINADSPCAGSTVAASGQQIDSEKRHCVPPEHEESSHFKKQLSSPNTCTPQWISDNDSLVAKPRSALKYLECDLRPEDQKEAIRCLRKLPELTTFIIHSKVKAGDAGLWREAFPLARLQHQYSGIQIDCAPLCLRQQLSSSTNDV